MTAKKEPLAPAPEKWSTREVLDQMRTWHAKNVKPFQQMPEVLEAAVDIIEIQLPAAKKELEGLNKFIGELRTDTTALETELAKQRERTTAALKEAKQAEDGARRAIADSEARATEREAALTKEYDIKRGQADAELTAHVTKLKAEVTELTKVKAALETEAAALRKKFAAF